VIANSIGWSCFLLSLFSCYSDILADVAVQSRNTREKADYSTFSVSNNISGGFLKIENLGSFGHSLGKNLTCPKIVGFISLWTSPHNSTDLWKSTNSTNPTFIPQIPHLAIQLANIEYRLVTATIKIVVSHHNSYLEKIIPL
jgi:hypothetical protein